MQPFIESESELEALYGHPGTTATVKEVAWITPEYRRFIAASPFVVLATSGPEGLDCSPRGDAPGFVRCVDERTLIIPDRRGNNRLDSLRNIVRDPRLALLFLIPGVGNTLRINGRARVCIAPELVASFAVEGKQPKSVIEMRAEAVYFQCARALMRSALWDAGARVDPATLPTPGQMLAALSAGQVGGEAYDQDWPKRARESLW